MRKVMLMEAALMLCSLQVSAQFGGGGEPSKAKAKVMTTLTKFTQTSSPMYMNDVVYAHASDMDLHLQIVMPEMAFGKKWPCVVFIQGSAWFKQECHSRMPVFSDFSKRGYVVASVEYRPSTTAIYPAQIQDVKTAVRFLKKNAARYGVDTTNVFIWGDSSGGNMSLLECLTQDVPSLDTKDYGTGSLAVNGCVAFYPVTDIIHLRDYSHSMDHESPNCPEGVLFGRVPVMENADKMKTASPIEYVSKEKASRTAPILIMTGNNDHVLPFEQSVAMADKLEACGYDYKFYKLDGADHGSWQFWTPETLDIVDQFFKAHIKR
jgi:acetyl esterase/lipase